MTARVGPVSAKFRGRLSLSDIKPPHSYALAFEGQGGAAGFAKGGAQVKLFPEKNQTKLVYDVKANVGGKLAQIGSRLVDAAAKKDDDEFFNNFNKRVSAVGEDTTVIIAPESEHGHAGAAGTSAAAPRSVSNTTLIFFAAGSLVVLIVALVALFG
jgi:predicted amidohydrolase